MADTSEIEALISFATTDRQREILQAVIEHGTKKAAAIAIGIDPSTVRQTLRIVTANAAKMGHSPDHDMKHTVPDGFRVKGVSTMYDSDGNVKIQWCKSQIDADKQLEIAQAAVAGMSASIPRVAPLAPPEDTVSDLANLYTLTDCHIGQMSWAAETGGNWDIKEGVRVVTGAWHQAVSRSPKAGLAIINVLGDFVHFDGLAAATPASGNLLDTDTRFPKLIKEAYKLLRTIVDQALLHHDTVHLAVSQGNHDESMSVVLPMMFSVIYEDEPRLTVDCSPQLYTAYEHGECMIGFHHGHKLNGKTGASRLAALFANRPEWQGKAHRYIHTGHLHSRNESEVPGCLITQHRTLIAADAYSARAGYDSKRGMSSITYHKKFGINNEVTVTPEMI
jgi:hypothetical protein